jgi:hypothetical protein
MKSGSLNLLEPSGPVQACNGIALSLLRHFVIYMHYYIIFKLKIELVNVQQFHKTFVGRLYVNRNPNFVIIRLQSLLFLLRMSDGIVRQK